jgi:propanol-preferring alcohol dehydrogenase
MGHPGPARETEERVPVRAEQLIETGPIADRPLRSADLPEGEPRSGELAIEVAACGVCRTDLQLVEGDLNPRRLPIVPGHQVAGRVAALGPDTHGWQIGDRVGIGWLAGTCGRCRFCRSERENLCPDARFTGWDRDGGYAEAANVRADFALALPEELDDLEIAPLLCGGIIGYRALGVSGIRPGGRLGLFGFGASALLAIQVALHWDCEVFVVTRSERDRRRAVDMGAAWAGSYDDRIPSSLDAAVTFAPVGSVVVAALRSLDRGGVVAVNAIHLDRIPEFPYQPLWLERQIRSVANYTREDAREFLRLAAEIPIRTITDPYPLAQSNTALLRLAEGGVDGAAVLTM